MAEPILLEGEPLLIGTPVWYSPILGETEYAGVTRTEPWRLGHGEPVVHLGEMEPAYGHAVGHPGRTTVCAAMFLALRRRSRDAEEGHADG